LHCFPKTLELHCNCIVSSHFATVGCSRVRDFMPRDSEELSVPLLSIPEIVSPSGPYRWSRFPWDQWSRSSLAFHDFTFCDFAFHDFTTWVDSSFQTPDSRLSSSRNHLSTVQISSSTSVPDFGISCLGIA
jgi:hypothetical protein